MASLSLEKKKSLKEDGGEVTLCCVIQLNLSIYSFYVYTVIT